MLKVMTLETCPLDGNGLFKDAAIREDWSRIKI